MYSNNIHPTMEYYLHAVKQPPIDLPPYLSRLLGLLVVSSDTVWRQYPLLFAVSDTNIVSSDGSFGL